MDRPEENEKDQEEILDKKGHVTRSDIGLQIWGDEPMGIGEGTAERAARVARGQRAAREAKKKRPDPEEVK